MNDSTLSKMSASEESSLLKIAQDRQHPERVNALARLWEAYAPAVNSAVRRYRDQIPADDAEQEAYLAFLGLVDSHDHEQSGRLAGRIRRGLSIALNDATAVESTQWAIPARTLQRFHGILRRVGGDLREGARVAPEYALSEETFNRIAALLRQTDSLTAPAGSADNAERDNTHALAGVIVGAETRDDFATADTVMLATFARNSLADPEDRQIVDLTYGFVPVEYEGAFIPAPVSDDIVGPIIGKSARTVRRRRTAALEEMRAALGLVNEEEGI